jgi:hypothetical protein
MTRRNSDARKRARVRFDRNELSGAFGDIGTDFPLIAGLILTAGLDPASVLVMFGAMQVLTGVVYAIPMPAQPLKAMAAITITQRLDADVLLGGGFAIGVLMLLLTATGILERLARAVPLAVVRGIQFGLGLQLALLALRNYIPADGGEGWILAGLTFTIVVALLGNRRFPPAVPAIALGVVYAVVLRFDSSSFAGSLGFTLPRVALPDPSAIVQGLVLLALPQLPLSLGNSVLATHRLADDLFPDAGIGVRKIGLTYSAMNLINPFFGGVPTCHGSGGIAGHYQFGGRTGGSVLIYGALYLVLGLFAAAGFGEAVELFPLPVLGIILAFEGLSLMTCVGTLERAELRTALLVGLIAAGAPYGYLIGAVVGIVVLKIERVRKPSSDQAHRR